MTDKRYITVINCDGCKHKVSMALGAWCGHNSDNPVSLPFIVGIGYVSKSCPVYEPPDIEGMQRAIEHGHYLADAAQRLMDEINRCAVDDHIEPDDGMSDSWGGLRFAIHDFTKRAPKDKP